jgi:cytochrome c553
MRLDRTPAGYLIMNLSRVFGIGILTVCASGLAATAFTPAWAEGNAAAGKQKTWTCEGCHGIPDYRTAYPDVYSVPKLGGQSAGYIVKALQDYKSGSRKNTTMRAIAARLSDEDITDLAAYYSGIEAAK